MSEVTIAPADVLDLDALAKVINSGYRTEGGWTTEHGLVEGDRITPSALTLLLSDPHQIENNPVFAAKIDGQIVGSIQAELVPESSGDNTSRKAVLGLFAVDPTKQSKGIGGKLVRYALQHMKEHWHCHQCEIWVLEGRDGILNWYRKLGFVEVQGPEGRKPFVWSEKLTERSRDWQFQVLRKQL